MKSKQAGFSLIELMIVVAIIGILSTIAVPNYNVMVKTRLSKSILQGIAHNLQNARSAQDDASGTLIQLSGSGCTACEAPTGSDIGAYVPGAGTIAAWKAYGYENGPPKDAWGHYIMLDENDLEFGATDCRFDALYSAGPDGIYSGFGDGDDVGGDDLIVRIPYAGTRSESCPGYAP